MNMQDTYQNWQGKSFGNLVARIADLSAEEFAHDLAFGGMDPSHLRRMASEWVQCGFTPASIADDILTIANDAQED